MNKAKALQYSILVIIGILLNYQFLPFGDYCVGLFSALKFLLIGGIFAIIVVVICLINLNHRIKNRRKFDFIPVIIFSFFSLTTYLLMENDYDKFWTKTILTGKIESEHKPRSGNLKLYENGTFEISIRYVDFTCNYSGNYKIQDNFVKLERENLESETENFFTTEYRVYSKERKMKPLKKEFEEIVIQ